MEFRIYIPDSPRRAWRAALYWAGIRKSPAKIYSIEDVRHEHRKHLARMAENQELREKNMAQRARIIELSKELSYLKRGSGAGRDQCGIANPDMPGSTPAGASICRHS